MTVATGASMEAEFAFRSTVLPVWAVPDLGLNPWPVDSSGTGLFGAPADG